MNNTIKKHNIVIVLLRVFQVILCFVLLGVVGGVEHGQPLINIIWVPINMAIIFICHIIINTVEDHKIRLLTSRKNRRTNINDY